MTQELFYFVVHPNVVIVRRENGASFESSAPVMFAHTRVDTLAITADNRLEYRPFWISKKNSHVWMTFEVHKRVMDGKVMEFFAEVRHVGSSNRVRLPGPSTDPAPSHVLALEDVAMRDYNSGEDSDYEEESSCHSTKEDEEVPNTPDGCPRLVLPTPLPIPDLAQVPCFFQQLNIDVRHVEDTTMEAVDVEYHTDGGAEFMVGHRMRNREVVLMAVKNYSIRRNAEYKVVESDRLKYHCRCKHHAAECPWMIRVALRQNLGYWYDTILCVGGAKDRFAAHLYGTRHGGRSLSARQHIDDECRDAPGED
ncbi:hypothetical protein PIB30_037047 [Stylosanthes scabra]|uniref:Transposase MuDR plant domain-containing protein n=1 Tax=Stylosanthes scabra TaxID=79078 RepID=A0ABU6UCY9_9FABA|nr:hypothetical protein [Stylosanthes scabra]